MRGKRSRISSGVRTRRNIPAYAGKTVLLPLSFRLLPEHPRVCGENDRVQPCRLWLPGTSPRMRGKQVEVFHHFPPAGNIPAYAGKTEFTGPGIIALGEHPRVCGENRGTTGTLVAFYGTSPRMRGKLACSLGAIPRSRNIPAYAGKTSGHDPIGGGQPEHPRVCGENMTGDGEHGSGTGTSPRMRGKLAPPLQIRNARRNIPAYAGKTLQNDYAARLQKEHPRVCGEN